MSYLHIENLYRNQTIRMFRECYAMEKVHGTSAHIKWKAPELFPEGIDKDGNRYEAHTNPAKLSFFSGGESHDKFVALFDQAELQAKFEASGPQDITIFGEAYGGKCQGMSATYGKELRFIAFDVQIGEWWLDVPKAAALCADYSIEFVPYVKIETSEEAMNGARDTDSCVAISRGMGPGKKMEGVVLRPLIELRLNNGDRVIAKHKRDDFKETSTARSLDPAQLVVLEEAEAIAAEWVVPMRLEHVLDKLPAELRNMQSMPIIIKAMTEDVLRESVGEVFVKNEEAAKTLYKVIAKVTAQLMKRRPVQSA